MAPPGRVIQQRPRNPAIPGTTRDRTGSAGTLRRAAAEIRRRFTGLQLEVLAIFDRIRIIATNDAATDLARTLYAMTPEEMAATSQALQEALDRWIASGRDPAHLFWWSPYVSEASQLGTAQSVSNLTNLSPVYAAARTLQTVVFSEAYRTRVGIAQVKSYDHWTGLSQQLKGELSQIIGRAVVDGKNPRAVRAEIAERLDVSRAKALAYAQTDITDTLRQARWAESEHATAEMGLNLALLWTSALLPTTRATHAARHAKTFSARECREFYAQPGQRYNCHCGQTECLLDEEGKPILSKALKDAMAKELKAWGKARA